VTRPLIAPLKTTFWAVSNTQLANTTNMLHTIGQLVAQSDIAHGRITNSFFIVALVKEFIAVDGAFAK